MASNNNNAAEPGLIAGHAQWVKGATVVRYLLCFRGVRKESFGDEAGAILDDLLDMNSFGYLA